MLDPGKAEEREKYKEESNNNGKDTCSSIEDLKTVS
jgi:hypothetical protein